MQKNVASQKWRVFAFDDTTGKPKTGDAANITAKISQDGGTETTTDDANPTESTAAAGYYDFALTQAESNGDILRLIPVSATANIQVIGSPATIDTVPPNHADGLIAATGEYGADVQKISGDATAADNLESQYDEVGLTGDNFPSKQSQLSGLASVGSAINTSATLRVLTTGSEVNAVGDTVSVDGTEHEISDAAGALEIYYEFQVGGDGVPTATKITGRIEANGDDVEVFAFNWGTTTFEKIGDYIGQNGSTNNVDTFDLFTTHVGTGADLGKVRIRFFAASGLTAATLFVDQIFVSFAVVNRSVGYELGAVWIDTNGSNENTVNFIDGTADNPVSTIAAATTLAESLGIRSFFLVAGSSVTLAQTYTNYQFLGGGYIVAGGGQAVSGTRFFNAVGISGIFTGAVPPVFTACKFTGTTTLPESEMRGCTFQGTIIFSDAAKYLVLGGQSGLSNGVFPIFDFSTPVNTDLVCRAWFGPIQVEGMGDVGVDTLSLDGTGKLIEVSCTAGQVFIRGPFEVASITNLTLNQDARLDSARIQFASDQALQGQNLDSLFNTRYDPASPPGVADSLWNQILEDNGVSVPRFTHTALENAPSAGAGFISGLWRWSTNTAETDPTTGRVKADNATLADITKVFIHQVTDNAQNRSNVIEALTAGDRILIEREGAGDNFFILDVSGAATDNGSWFTIPGSVAVGDSGGSLGNNNAVIVTFGFAAGGGSGISKQDVADSMLLAPVGSEASGSVQDRITTILTRLTATIFAGMTSLAQWFGIIAGKQSGDATARTELRATGAGSGTFDESTDALEAIRDTAPLGTAMRGTDGANTQTPLDAAGTRAAVGLAAANLDTQLAAIKVDTAATKLDTTAIRAITDAIGPVAAAKLAKTLSDAGVPDVLAQTGTLTITQTSTDLTETTDDHFNDRVMIFIDGALAGQAVEITAYDGTGKILTHSALTGAAVNGDNFVMV